MLVFHESAIPPATTDPDPEPDPARGEVFGVVQDPDVTTLPVRKQGALFRARWWRVVLDEVYQPPSPLIQRNKTIPKKNQTNKS